MKARILGAVKWGCFLPALVILVFVATFLVSQFFFLPPTPRKALPATASDIREKRLEENRDAPGVQYMKAKMPEEEFAAYAKKLGFKEHFEAGRIQSIYGPIDEEIDAPEWWDAPALSAAALVKTAGLPSFFESLRYADGCVYYKMVGY